MTSHNTPSIAPTDSVNAFRAFAAALRAQGHEGLANTVIGDGTLIQTHFGTIPLLYADYVASGRALAPIEHFIMEHVLPFYANSHTEASYCGSSMTRLRNESRRTIAELCSAPQDQFSTIFSGAGATSGLNRLVHLANIPEHCANGTRPVVLIGPYEHHSNILPWRESGAELIEIPEAKNGGPDLTILEGELQKITDADPNNTRVKIGSFSAASNVTGIITDTDAVTRLLKRHNALAIWDYAGAGPYLPIDMKAGTPEEKDAVVISCHKFLGGPGASGLLIARNAAFTRKTPSAPGGGTVRFVSPWGHDYSENLVAREEGGTPNVLGDIRAALAFVAKDAIGAAYLAERQAILRQKALSAWANHPAIEILGNTQANALPIFSFRIHDIKNGGSIHQQLFTRMLSDKYGIQARGGCACAGPYAHRLLDINESESETIRSAIMNGEEIQKPGWVRLNLSVLMSDEKVDYILKSVIELASNPHETASFYDVDRSTARFKPAA
ncbi:aminotransferase class V-fold PLP-dependent enzyme [Neokomagataea anthophila]|uniref:Aminotransferase class V-fold PLP-dependent enzyme n=1 Tax=Neokomagataea anthophila TaxID=2826925 RepID=A0ABS5E899_9PROT|nr:aminotransferase class V-fold PLP-dependent enzyme [Neokomagataea anthophila]MBR0560129.1 aminotransferase class V-fold PLP-dependent enzyme [Neokomagataea anthophila]